jgi:transcriptional regulator with GAF, ATPase, and Fis domain
MARIEQVSGFGEIIGKNPEMQTVYQLIEDVAPTDVTILIQGESGTGKELAARAIHDRSARKERPLVVINCAAYPPTLLESELFGHEKGSFTGAMAKKAGRFELADGGTVLLDEIGEISASAQIKLLRVLQTQKFERVGGEKTLEVDVRILAATNKNLLQRVKEGTFREDLYYRLNVILLNLPPLRKRQNDIPLLAKYFLERFVAEQNKNIHDFEQEAMRFLLNYNWPGNVRELENSIEHAVVLAKESTVLLTDLPSAILEEGSLSLPDPDVRQCSIVENEENLIRKVLEESEWNKTAAAVQLGISRSTLYEKLKKYQIEKPTLH